MVLNILIVEFIKNLEKSDSSIETCPSFHFRP